MQTEQQDHGQPGRSNPSQPLGPDERRRQRQLLAERIGQLLARHWLRQQQGTRSARGRPLGVLNGHDRNG